MWPVLTVEWQDIWTVKTVWEVELNADVRVDLCDNNNANFILIFR